MILTIRTDKSEAEVGLFELAAGSTELRHVAYKSWMAHRQLAEGLLTVITGLLEGNSKRLSDVQAIVVFKGPGSFTGLRIGLTVANALADSHGLPIVGQCAEQSDAAPGDAWIQAGASRLAAGESDIAVMPFYGAEANITKPRTA